MTDIDDVLRSSFARIAEPGDPAGVAEAIRTRMAAGDTGTPAASSGFGSRLTGLWPYLALAVVLAVGGGALGFSGLLTPAATIHADAPLLPVAMPTVTPSPSAPPTVEVTTAPEPVEPPQAASPADTTAPTLSGASATPPTGVCADDSYDAYYPITSTIAVSAADDSAVVGVHLSWSGAESGSAEMAFGSSWTYIFDPAPGTPSGTVTFTMVAHDPAGNSSAPATTSVTVINTGGCLI